MSRQTTLKGNALTLLGEELHPGDAAPDFSLADNGLGTVALGDTSGVRVINVVPSLDTPICDAQIKRFNEEAANLEGVSIYCVSCDLPFAQARWCGASDVENVTTLSDYKDGNFGNAWGTMIDELRIQSRAVFVLNEHNTIVHAEYVPEVTEHPNYDAALAAAKGAS